MVSDTDMGMEKEEEQGMMGGEASSEVMESEKPETPEMAPTATAAPKRKAGGRRAALRIIREHVEGVSKELSAFRKSHETSAKRVEKQISTLRNDVAALKTQIAKETARLREKQESLSSKVLAKVSKPTSAKKSSSSKRKKGKSKGKK